jgi:hypothetical protein
MPKSSSGVLCIGLYNVNKAYIPTILILPMHGIHCRIHLPARAAYNKCRPVWLQTYVWTNLSCKQRFILDLATHQWSSCRMQLH